MCICAFTIDFQFGKLFVTHRDGVFIVLNYFIPPSCYAACTVCACA